MIKALIAGLLTITGITGAYVYQDQVFGVAPNVLRPSQGGTGVGTAGPSDVGKVYKVSDDSPFTVTLQDDNTGAGGSFPFTPTSYGNSTSSVLGLLGGVFSNASSTFHILKAGSASTTNLTVSSLNSANCDVKASSDGTFSCGTDATGSGGGSGTVSTSTNESKGFLAYWASDSATPALLGEVATTSLTISSPLTTSGTAGALVGGSNLTIGIDTSGTWTGNAGTASALAANGSNCSAGSGAGGVSASGVAEDCTDYYATLAEFTGTLTDGKICTYDLAGGEIDCDYTDQVGGGSTDSVFWANASTSPWTVASLRALSSSTIAFLDSVRATSTDHISTNATTSILSASTHIRSLGSLRVDNLTSALVLTGANGTFAEYTGIDCTNQFVRDVSSLGAGTCATVTSADVDLADLTATDTTLTFSGAYDGQTARTIGVNLGANFAWAGAHDFGGATSLEIPNGTNPTVDALGECAIDTTTGQLLCYDGSAVKVFVPDYGEFAMGFTFASSSQGKGTTTKYLGVAPQELTFTDARCDFNKHMLIRVGDGTNWGEQIMGSSTIGTTTLSNNRTFFKGESIRVEIGTSTTGLVDVFGGCTYHFNYVRH